MTPTPPSVCPCGCGQTIPQHASNVWVSDAPYWAWICPNTRCEWEGQEWLNQSGDGSCSMCGKPREFAGHFQGSRKHNSSKNRITMQGEHYYRGTAHRRMKKKTRPPTGQQR